MSAFVPSLGVSIKPSNSFVTGCSSVSTNDGNRVRSVRPTKHASSTIMMADDKKEKGEKKGMSLRIDQVMRSKLDKKKEEKQKADLIQKARAASVSAGKVVLKTSVQDVPKFYNPTTARYEFEADAKGQNSTPFDIRVISESNKPSDNRRENVNGTFRNMDPYTNDLYWARPGWSVEQANIGIQIALRQIFGNANLFESDLQQLDYSISCVKQTANMKEFIRALGLSGLYREKYFESTSNLRFIEVNFKHFLGRAPRNQEEISKHIQIINEQGYNAEINSYVDSEEYDILYGDSRIPASNFQGGYPENADMNRLALVNGSYVAPDTRSKIPIIQDVNSAKYSAFSVLKGLPEAWRGENRARTDAGIVSAFPESPWNSTPDDIRSDEIDWKMKFGSWQTYWYKDSVIYKTMMKPVLTHSDEEKEEAAAILKYGSSLGKLYTRKTD